MLKNIKELYAVYFSINQKLPLKLKISLLICYFTNLITAILEMCTVMLFFPIIFILLNGPNTLDFNVIPFGRIFIDIGFNNEMKINSIKSIILLLSVLIVVILKNCINLLIINYNANIVLKIAKILYNQLSDIYFNLEVKDLFAKNINAITQNINNISRNIQIFLFNIIQSFGTFIFVMLILLFIAVIMIKYILFIILMCVFIIYVYQKLLVNNSNRIRILLSVIKSDMGKFSQLLFFNIREIKIFDNNSNILSQFNNKQEILLKETPKELMIHYLTALFTEFIVLFVLSIVVIVIYVGRDMNIILPKITILVFVLLRLIPLVIKIPQLLIESFGVIENVKAILIDIDSMGANNQIKNIDKKTIVPIVFNKNIKFENVSLKYSNRDSFALSNINCVINKNDTIGIIGKSGSGKTTFADILLGLLTPTSGRVLVDDKDLQFDSWKNNISFVPQQIAILSNHSILENIAFAVNKEDIDIDKVYKILDIVDLTSVVTKLPNGINSDIGFNGLTLSGGQRQRLGIARALYFDRNILILDEATSALDIKTEKDITLAIDKLKGDKTMIIIAHRLSTLKHCDKIMYFKDGQILDIGTFYELSKHDEINEILKLYNLDITN